MDRKNRLVMVIIFTILIFLSLLESQVFSDKSESTEQQPITNISTIAPSAIVELTAKGDYQPKSVRIKRGQAVRFVNQSQSLMWPASDPHPSHKDYPGFDPRQIIHPGENWQFTFERTGTFGYHDHLNPMRRGQIVVTD